MGDFTLVKMTGNIQRRLGGRIDKDEDIHDAINLAQGEIARAFVFEDLYADPFNVTLSNTGDVDVDKTFTLPTNYDKLMSISLYDSTDTWIKEVEALPKKFWEQLISEPSLQTREEPLYYVHIQDKIYLFPVPDQTYTARLIYTITPADLVLDTDVSILKNKDDLIIYKATADVMLLLGMEQQANTYFAAYKRKLEEAKKDSNHPDTNLGKTTRHFIRRFIPNYHLYPFLKR